MINFIRNDFRNVKGALKMATNDKLPTWIIVIYYCLVAPICFLLLPFVKILVNMKLKKILKGIEAE